MTQPVKRARDLAVASVANTPDVNDKLGLLASITQYINDTGYLDANAIIGLTAANFTDYVPWTAVPYAAANFTSDTGTWTVDSGDQLTFRYMQLADMMWVSFGLLTTTIAGSPLELYIKIPNNKTATVRMDAQLGNCIENGTGVSTGGIKVVAGGTNIAIYKPSSVAWANSTNNNYFLGQIFFQFNR